jgi:hypothetical protein
MADQNEVVVQFKAVVADFLDKMGAAHKGTQEATEKISSSLNGIGAGFEKLMTTIGALSAVLAGGAMFKEAISETINWTGEVVNLSKKVGITSEAASGLALALHHVGMSSEDYGGMVNKMTKQMRANGDAFDQLGIQTKDSNGEWRNSQDVMLDVIEKMNGMKKGTDLNVVSQALFGGRVGDINKLLKINMELIEEETRKAEKLNLVVGPDGAAQAREYKEAMADLHADMLGLSVGVGSALIPTLSKLTENLSTVLMPVVKVVGTIFAALGDIFGILVDCVGDLWNTVSGAIKEAFEPLSNLFSGDLFTGANVLKVVLGTIETVIVGITLAVKMLVTLAVTAFENMVTSAMAFGRAIKAVFTGDFQGAVAAAKDANDKIEANNKKAMDKIVGDALAANQKIQAIWAERPEPKKSKEPGGETTHGNDFKAGKKEKPESLMPAYAAELDELKDKILQDSQFLVTMSKAQELAFWQAKLTVAGTSAEDLKKIHHQVVAAEQAVHTELMAQQKKDAAESRAMDAEDTNFKIQSSKIDLQTKKQQLAELAAAGRITREEELRQTIELQKAEAALNKAALADELKNLELTDLARKKINDKILLEDKKLAADTATLNRQITAEASKHWVQLGQTIQSSLGNALTSIITKTQSFTQALRNLFKSVTDSMVQMLVQMGLEQAKQFLMRKLMGKEAAASDISAGAGSYAVNAMSSVAAIPVTGWAMAPGVGAAAFANAIGYMGSIASAAGGWDIPAGINPMAQLHSREMVLPEEHADTIRGLKGGGGPQIHFNITAMDGKDVHRTLLKHQDSLYKVLSQGHRNGRLG